MSDEVTPELVANVSAEAAYAVLLCLASVTHGLAQAGQLDRDIVAAFARTLRDTATEPYPGAARLLNAFGSLIGRPLDDRA